MLVAVLTIDAPPHLQACTQPESLADGARVLQLNFGDPRITQWNTLTGTITPVLGNLTCELAQGGDSTQTQGRACVQTGPAALRACRGLTGARQCAAAHHLSCRQVVAPQCAPRPFLQP